MNRFSQKIPLSLMICCVGLVFSGPCVSWVRGETKDRSKSRPNILWITCEDMGPHLGCYGDSFAVTPHLDRLANRSLRYRKAWSNAPVCAPARTTLITGIYPTSTGAEHMRSLTRLPAGMKFFPQYLREAGYYCTNNSKEDYNLELPGEVWDESSKTAHYRNRKEGQPFFAVFNLTMTHESQIRTRPHTLKHDPAQVRIPAYHPDTPEVRHDWAQYYDNITVMDAQAGKLLDELDAAGLNDSTIVFFYSDHGSGMPRNKRWPYNCGLHVPLLIHIPEGFQRFAPNDYQPGQATNRLVSFVDFGPSVLSLAGIPAPDTMQGEAFLGEHAEAPREFLHGFRGRMDERYDMVRSVTDGRHVYVRNYLPHLIYGQHLDYMFETPTTRIWKQLFDEGKLTPEQSAFWKSKPPEELYDLETDPDEVRNLAGEPRWQPLLQRLRAEQEAQILRARDVGLLPEEEIHARSRESSPYELGHNADFPIERIAAMAHRAANLKQEELSALQAACDDAESAVRYWAVLGIRMRGESAVTSNRQIFETALNDASPNVRLVAAEALARWGTPEDRKQAVEFLLSKASYENGSVFLALAALNLIDSLELHDAEIRQRLQLIPPQIPPAFSRSSYGIPRLLNRLTRD